MHIVQLHHVTKRYGTVTALTDVSLGVERGRITGLLGPAGAGKSTTCKLVLGVAAPSAGEITVLGRRFSSLPAPATRVGGLLEHVGLHPGRTGRDHLRALQIAARIDPERVDEVLHLLGLVEVAAHKAKVYPRDVRRRMGLAAALLGSPDLLVLDEPGVGLDPAGARWLDQALVGFCEAGGTVLLTSPVAQDVARVAHDVVLMHAGRVVDVRPLADFGGVRSLESTYAALTARQEVTPRAC